MKKLLYLLFAMVSAAVLFTGCHINDFDDRDRYDYDNNPPSAPTGVMVLNGDNTVQISWDWNRENDIDVYNVYYSDSYDGRYKLIGSTSNNFFNDNEAVNGNRYYYAVAAVDYNGNESDLSREDAHATPRPQGSRVSIFDWVNYPDRGAFSFTTYSTVDTGSADADFFYENYNGHYLFVREDTDIQDMGPTNDIYDIEYAPTTGWSPTKDVLAIAGHTYVIWTFDDHYAKVRVRSITGDQLVFDWAFQLVKGERQLKPKQAPAQRPPLDQDWLKARRAAR